MYLYVQSDIQCTYLQFYIILYKYMKYIHICIYMYNPTYNVTFYIILYKYMKYIHICIYMYNPTYNVLIYNFTNYMKLYMCVCVYVCDIVTTTEDK